MAKKRGFGTVRQLASGRWQARYPGPDGILRPAPQTFERKRDAGLYLAEVQSQQARGTWIDPEAGKILLGVYAKTWLEEHTGLADTTAERYESALRLYVEPYLGHEPLNELTTAKVRTWYSARLKEGKGRPSVAKAYRFMRAVLNTAVTDKLIGANPCRIKGASDDKSPERPTLTVAEVHSVIAEVPERFRLMVLLGTFTTLRLGELAGLRRRDLDLDAGWVKVVQEQVELSTGRLVVKAPKSEAGKREVGIPSDLLPAVKSHVDKFAESGRDGRVFVGAKGGYVRRQNFRRLWTSAIEKSGVTPVHFHDLRHTGNTLAARGGANLRELMQRMGHSSPRAALIYLHATQDRERVIADSMNVHLPSSVAINTQCTPVDTP